MPTPRSRCGRAAPLARLLLLVAAPLLLLLPAPTPAFAPPRPGTRSITSRGDGSAHRQETASALEAASPVDAGSATAEEGEGGDTEKGRRGRRRLAVLLCPAQFCVPLDYADLLADIRAGRPDADVDVVAARAAPLPRTEWIKVARQLPTKDFLDAALSVPTTLGWYFDAIETALADLFAEAGGDVDVCLLGHSIGGWVARAYLGGLGRSSTAVYRLARDRVTSLVTLGTPHASPDSALVDQTRGLLRAIASSPPCSSRSLAERGIKVTCVGGTGVAGRLLSTDPEELLAAASYLPLVGRSGPDVRGDGIVPAEVAFMDPPARRVEVGTCEKTGGIVRHAHVLPTPWNLLDGAAPSVWLPGDVAWYGSPGVIGRWLKYVE